LYSTSAFFCILCRIQFPHRGPVYSFKRLKRIIRLNTRDFDEESQP
jgi:hypothetical protein